MIGQRIRPTAKGVSARSFRPIKTAAKSASKECRFVGERGQVECSQVDTQTGELPSVICDGLACICLIYESHSRQDSPLLRSYTIALFYQLSLLPPSVVHRHFAHQS